MRAFYKNKIQYNKLAINAMHSTNADTVARIRRLVQLNHAVHATALCTSSSSSSSVRRVDGHLRAMIADEQRYRCALCHSLFAGGYHVDHKCPQYQGGTSDRSNLWALCVICHGRKTALEQSMRVEAVRKAVKAVEERAGTMGVADATLLAKSSVCMWCGEAHVPHVPHTCDSPAFAHVRDSGANAHRREVQLLADWNGPFMFGSDEAD